jgi:hypothetical protein
MLLAIDVHFSATFADADTGDGSFASSNSPGVVIGLGQLFSF